MALSDSVRQQISELVTQHRVVLFMKGSRRAPQCGFSAQVVQILDQVLPTYQTVDVLSSPELRDGIKTYSDWPTIPQLYVDGQFIGGCDIVRDLQKDGELSKLLAPIAAEQVASGAVNAPRITVTAAAAQAFADVLGEAGSDVLRLTIDPQFRNDLFFAPAEATDIRVASGGLTLHLDPGSASRAEGLEIDFVTGPEGGFKLNNPNAPPTVKQVRPAELKQLLDRGGVVLFDVRPHSEAELARIEGSRSLHDAADRDYLQDLDPNTPIALYCHHGMRSLDAAQQLLTFKFRNVYNLQGGIDAWSREVDPSVPRY